MTIYVHKEDCRILRSIDNNPGFSMLVDEDGDEVFSVPEAWTDEQIWLALEIAQAAHTKGARFGRKLAQNAMKDALGIDAARER